MKDLIKKVLRESINAKDLIEKGEVITRMYNDLEKLTGSRKTGVTNADDFFWYVVDLLDYKKDDDYKRVKKYLMDLNRFAGVPSEAIRLLEKIIIFKSTSLDISSDRGRGINVGDDGWGDLRVDVISRGKDFYDSVINDSDIMKKMADNYDYSESFLYGIPYEDELI
jgi:hypothetical protein